MENQENRPFDFILTNGEFDELINLIDCVLQEGDYPLTREPLSPKERMHLHGIMQKFYSTFVKEEEA